MINLLDNTIKFTDEVKWSFGLAPLRKPRKAPIFISQSAIPASASPLIFNPSGLNAFPQYDTEKPGYRADVANNGREAIAAIRSSSYQLILMDIQMPVMDGLAATRAIRRDKDLVNDVPMPIVALTAHAMRGDRQACFEAGMDDYLSKPINAKQLAETIAHHIGQAAT